MMTATQFEIGTKVERINSDKWTNGNRGHVVEVSDGRVRVMWTETHAEYQSGKRTWIKASCLKAI